MCGSSKYATDSGLYKVEGGSRTVDPKHRQNYQQPGYEPNTSTAAANVANGDAVKGSLTPNPGGPVTPNRLGDGVDKTSSSTVKTEPRLRPLADRVQQQLAKTRLGG